MIQSTNTLVTTIQAVAACSALILTDVYFYYEAEISGNIKVFKENQLLENLQVILLFVAGLTFSQAIAFVQKGLRLLPLAGALLSLSFILRELDVETFAIPRFLIVLGSGYGRNLMLTGLWLWVVFAFLRTPGRYFQTGLGLLTRRTGLFALTAGLLLILGSLFEDRIFDVKLYELYEELAEMNGYYFLLLSSLYSIFDLPRKINPEYSIATKVSTL